MRATCFVFCLAWAVLSWAALGLCLAADKPKVDAAEIARLIKQLGHEKFEEREAAAKRLQEIGEPALAALREAAESGAEAEIRRRAARLVQIIGRQPPPPFWLAPKADLDLRSLAPAPVKLVAGPDTSRTFALLQTGPDAPSGNLIPSTPQLQPFVPEEDTGYRVVAGGLKDDALPYGDRKYKVQKLDAAFAGLTLLQTKAGHKAVLDGRYAIVLSTAKPCYVFVAVDERALETYKQHGVPAWLQEFAPTGHKLTTDDPIMAADNKAGYLVVVRKAPAGRIALGPPCLDISTNSMYFAFFAEPK